MPRLENHSDRIAEEISKQFDKDKGRYSFFRVKSSNSLHPELSGGAYEMDLVNFFRSFEPQDICDAYDGVIQEAYTAGLPLVVPRYKIHSGNQERIYQNYPDVEKLIGIILLHYDERLADTHINRFRALFSNPMLTVDALRDTFLPFIYSGTAERTMEFLEYAFTPRRLRDWNHFEFRAPNSSPDSDINLRMPDMTDGTYDTPEKRLDKVTELLSLTYEDALSYIGNISGLEQAQVVKDKDPEQYKRSAAEARAYLNSNSLIKIIADGTNNGRFNSFKHKKYTGFPPRTKRERCPAEAFVYTYLQGLGQSLSKNKATVMDLITSDSA